MDQNGNNRILLIDDNRDIHEDFRKILCVEDEQSESLKSSRHAFFGEEEETHQKPVYKVDSSFQGPDGLEMVRTAVEGGRPYALAFVDVRMPPGWDGVDTIVKLWEEDPDLHAVICTAYADYSWGEMVAKLGRSDKLLILKKPFDPVEVCQLASSLTAKWNATSEARQHMEDLRSAEQVSRDYAVSLEVVNRELERANAQAQAASKAKSEFLANMSHEIRTPMTAILGYADMLCDPVLPREELLVHVETISRNGKHLLSIVNDILDISRIEAGKMSIEPTKCSPFAIVNGVLSLMKCRADSENLSLSAEWNGPIPEFVQSDPTRLRQILINLVGNAIKFTDEGSVCISVRMEGASEAVQPALYFRVKDTGMGISPEDQESLFEAFNQADNSPTRQAGGTGLGLTISRRLARMLGGDIVLESTEGEGSTFSLSIGVGSLKAVRMLDHSTGAPRIRRDEPLEVGSHVGSLSGTVLLVDDEPLNSEVVASYLRRAGVEVFLADNASNACEIIAQAQGQGVLVDLVIVDMQIPKCSGRQTVQELREYGFSGPVIALTEHAMIGDREKCLEAGCDDYLSKPVVEEKLIATCGRLIGGDEPSAPLPSDRAPEGQSLSGR